MHRRPERAAHHRDGDPPPHAPNGDEWSGGEILDPKNGKTYRATMKLAEDGKKLIVRGYIGMPMFGRSQTWVRRDE